MFGLVPPPLKVIHRSLIELIKSCCFQFISSVEFELMNKKVSILQYGYSPAAREVRDNTVKKH